MLVYPKDIEKKLEIEELRKGIAKHCATDASLKILESARPFRKFEVLEKHLLQTREMMGVLDHDQKPALNGIIDLLPFLNKIKTNGTFLTADHLALLKSGLEKLYSWSQFLKKRTSDFPNLSRMAVGFISDKELIDEIESKVDDKGEVRENATPELAALRKKRFAAESKVRKTIHSLLEKSKKDEFTDEDGAVTIRGGRLVIPVRAEYKRKLPGFVHDESATGQTVFMEPTAVLDLNNEVRELGYEERREEMRILTRLADEVRSRLTDLEKGGDFILKIDFIKSKALYAREIEAIIPNYTAAPKLTISSGKHPILWKKNQELGKPTIPLTIQIDGEQRLVVISGPNAGGKSVALKTVGLLQYAFQCGFPVPVDESSEFGFFRNFFVDIGDSQSLENDLSTYSSHLQAMKYFCEFADKSTLVLIDEFGTGTEPQFGGPIAQAILDKINATKCRGVVTTHYGNLKEFADKTQGLVNAAMRYDVNRLEPLFQLEVGKPGSSFALEIAQKIGIQKDVLEKAKSLVGFDQVDYNRLLAELDNKRNELEANNSKVTKERGELATLRNDYEGLKKLLDRERKKVLNQARQEASQILSDANKQVENTIREIKEAQADKDKTKDIRKKLEKYGDKVAREKTREKTQLKVEEVLTKGDKVLLDEDNTVGEVISLKGKQAEVLFGGLKSFVKLERLTKVSNRQAKKKASTYKGGIDLSQRKMSFKSEVDIRGKRAEEVLPLLDKVLDDALLLGIDRLRILHGKGHGVLKELVRSRLKEDANVSSFEDEHADQGGSGVTLVSLR